MSISGKLFWLFELSRSWINDTETTYIITLITIDKPAVQHVSRASFACRKKRKRKTSQMQNQVNKTCKLTGRLNMNFAGTGSTPIELLSTSVNAMDGRDDVIMSDGR
jgi:hypothetical protein